MSRPFEWDRSSGWRFAAWAVLVGGVLVLLVLLGIAASEQSLTMDEPYHLLAGRQALMSGSNVLNWEHPPLVKLVAGLPFLWHPPGPRADPGGLVSVDRALAASDGLLSPPGWIRPIAFQARASVLAAFGLPFLAVTLLLGTVVAGVRAGLLLCLAVGLSFCVLPYLPIVQTDAAVGLGFGVVLVGSILFLRKPSWRWILVAGLGLGIALASKFSGLLLVAPLGWAVAAAPGLSLWRRIASFLSILAIGVGFTWATYAFANRDYDGAAGREAVVLYSQGAGTLVVDGELEAWRDRLLALEAISPSAAQWSVGFLGIRIQDRLGIYPSYAFGEVRSAGRWWYFPAVLAVRTPLVILIFLLLFGLGLMRRRSGSDRRSLLFLPAREVFLLGGTVLVYLAVAMASSYNLGVRHLLPILPVMFLPAAAWASRTPKRAIALASLLCVEAIALTPTWMSATNTWWLGDHNPTRFALGGADGDYEQGFRTLHRVAENRGWAPLHVVHPTATTAEIRLAMPGATKTRPFLRAREGLPEGWYAVSILAEQLVPAILAADPADLHGYAAYRRVALGWHAVLEEILERGEDRGYAAGVFHLYRVPAAEGPLPGEGSV